MDIDGPPDVGGGDGKKDITVRDELLLQQDAAAVALKPTVELPGVRAPVDLPQVCFTWSDSSIQSNMFSRSR